MHKCAVLKVIILLLSLYLHSLLEFSSPIDTFSKWNHGHHMEVKHQDAEVMFAEWNWRVCDVLVLGSRRKNTHFDNVAVRYDAFILPEPYFYW